MEQAVAVYSQFSVLWEAYQSFKKALVDYSVSYRQQGAVVVNAAAAAAEAAAAEAAPTVPVEIAEDPADLARRARVKFFPE